MSIHAIPGHFSLHRIKTNQKPAQFSSVRVGRNSIRPTDGHVGGRMNLIPIRFLIPRIKTNQNPDEFFLGRVGAYCIRPTNGHARGRMKLIRIKFLIPRIKTNQSPVHFSIHLAICMTICGAYAIRPYTDDLKKWRFFCPFDHRRGRLWGVCCCALHGQTKTGLVFGSYFEGWRKRGRGVGCAKSGVGALP